MESHWKCVYEQPEWNFVEWTERFKSCLSPWINGLGEKVSLGNYRVFCDAHRNSLLSCEPAYNN